MNRSALSFSLGPFATSHSAFGQCGPNAPPDARNATPRARSAPRCCPVRPINEELATSTAPKRTASKGSDGRVSGGAPDGTLAGVGGADEAGSGRTCRIARSPRVFRRDPLRPESPGAVGIPDPRLLHYHRRHGCRQDHGGSVTAPSDRATPARVENHRLRGT